MRVTAEMFELVDSLRETPKENIIGSIKPDNQMVKSASDKLEELSDNYGLFQSGPLKQRVAPVCNDFTAAQIRNGSKMLTIEATDSCNMRCDYCIFSGGYQFYRQRGSRNISIETARAAVDYYLSHKKGKEQVSIGFYGGEPLLNFDVIEKCCEYAREVEKINGQDRRLDFSITTNGTLLDDERISWLMEKEFSITVSCDGPASIHDKHRVFPNGRGSFDIVFQNLQKIYKKDKHFYKHHILINCVICPCSNLMDLRNFFERYSHLFGDGKLKVSNISEGNADYFKRHPPYLNRNEDLEDLHREYINAHIFGKTSNKDFLNSFSRQFFEQDYLFLHRRNVLNKAVDPLHRINTCFPGERKVFVDVDGNLHMCERVNRHFPIGDVWNGYDVERIKTIFNDFALTMDSDTCRSCWGVHLCQKCFTEGTNGVFPNNFQIVDCPNQLKWFETKITNYCSILEKNPSAFDYMDKYIIS